MEWKEAPGTNLARWHYKYRSSAALLSSNLRNVLFKWTLDGIFQVCITFNSEDGIKLVCHKTIMLKRHNYPDTVSAFRGLYQGLQGWIHQGDCCSLLGSSMHHEEAKAVCSLSPDIVRAKVPRSCESSCHRLLLLLPAHDYWLHSF